MSSSEMSTTGAGSCMRLLRIMQMEALVPRWAVLMGGHEVDSGKI